MKLLTPEEAEECLGISKATLANWRSQRSGPKFVKVGRLVRYTVADLEEWVKGRTVATHEFRELIKSTEKAIAQRRKSGPGRFGRHRTQSDQRGQF
jgi:excisionase family DNA binding protein